MAASDDFTPAEREVVELVLALRQTGNLKPLVALLRDGDGGPERARDALQTLGEWDLQMLVQIALDTLIDDYVEDPRIAIQDRRVVRNGA